MAEVVEIPWADKSKPYPYNEDKICVSCRKRFKLTEKDKKGKDFDISDVNDKPLVEGQAPVTGVYLSVKCPNCKTKNRYFTPYSMIQILNSNQVSQKLT